MAATFLPTSMALPQAAGLRLSTKAAKAKQVSLKACTCTKCATGVRVSASAKDSAETAHSEVASQALFASVAQAPPAPAQSSPLTVPAILGAGVLGGAAFALLQGGDAPAAAPVAAAPSQNGALIPRAKRAAPAALATMAATFPNAMQEETFIHAVASELFNLGFKRDNCIALVNTCRDEVCRPIVDLIDKEFGLSFNIAGLGGLVNCGKTGFGAAFSHSPEFPCESNGKPRERYIFFGFPHVSIGETGEVGSLLRRGRGKASSACGALIAIKNEIAAGGQPGMDENDPELSLLKNKIMAKVSSTPGDAPSLVQVTKAALAAITEDIEKLIAFTVNPETADYAVITGVQIHSGNQIPGEPFRIERTCDYIAPNAMYAVIRGEKHILHTEINQINTIKSVPIGMFKN